ncbi:MAG: hypothetical protein IKF14_03310 [Atopobiaceae bacterium]|nr:hypothetical protein [Atopobiaceae bacterium]
MEEKTERRSSYLVFDTPDGEAECSNAVGGGYLPLVDSTWANSVGDGFQIAGLELADGLATSALTTAGKRSLDNGLGPYEGPGTNAVNWAELAVIGDQRYMREVAAIRKCANEKDQRAELLKDIVDFGLWSYPLAAHVHVVRHDADECYMGTISKSLKSAASEIRAAQRLDSTPLEDLYTELDWATYDGIYELVELWDDLRAHVHEAIGRIAWGEVDGGASGEEELSLGEVARLLGVSEEAVLSWLEDPGVMPAHIVDEICDRTGLTLEYLRWGVDLRGMGIQERATPREVAILYADMSREQQAAITRLMLDATCANDLECAHTQDAMRKVSNALEEWQREDGDLEREGADE